MARCRGGRTSTWCKIAGSSKRIIASVLVTPAKVIEKRVRPYGLLAGPEDGILLELLRGWNTVRHWRYSRDPRCNCWICGDPLIGERRADVSDHFEAAGARQPAIPFNPSSQSPHIPYRELETADESHAYNNFHGIGRLGRYRSLGASRKSLA
jgi:hypothetical protein